MLCISSSEDYDRGVSALYPRCGKRPRLIMLAVSAESKSSLMLFHHVLALFCVYRIFFAILRSFLSFQ